MIKPATERSMRLLNIIDDFNREGLWIEADYFIAVCACVRVLKPSHRMARKPINKFVATMGRNTSVKSLWAQNQGITLNYIQPGKPQQNAYIERYNHSVRYDWFGSTCLKCWTSCRHTQRIGYGSLQQRKTQHGTSVVYTPSSTCLGL